MKNLTPEPIAGSSAKSTFAIRNLSVLQYANGFTLWHYKAATVGDLMSPNYFGPCGDMLQQGDHIHVSAPDGGALLMVSRREPQVIVKCMAAS